MITMKLDELREALKRAGIHPGDLRQAAEAYFVRSESQRHLDDIEQTKVSLRELREYHGDPIADGMREFLLCELARHECEYAKRNAAWIYWPASLRDKIITIPVACIRVTG